MKVLSQILLICCLSLANFSLVNGQSSDPPNILFIIIDDYNDFSGILEGHPQAFTPNIDRLARRGINFTNCFSNGVVSPSSRTSFLTGKDIEYTQMQNADDARLVFRDQFSEEQGNEIIYTIPEILKDSGGYVTIGMNKVFWGWRYDGFDNDYDDTSDFCFRTRSWNAMFDFESPCVETPDSCIFDGSAEGVPWGRVPPETEPKMRDVLTADSAISFLSKYAEEPSLFCAKPFFTVVGFWKPHGPHFVPERYYPDHYNPDIYSPDYAIQYNDPPNAFPYNGTVQVPQPDTAWNDFEALGHLAKIMTRYWGVFNAFDSAYELLDTIPVINASFTEEEREYAFEENQRIQYLMAYLASIQFVDDQVGRVIDELEKYPHLLENTIIVVTSDHGYSMGEKKHWHKASLWENVIRIPMIIVDPKREGGQTNESVISLLDLFPTFCDIAGIDYPTFPDGSRYLDGESLLPLVEDPGFTRNSTVVSSYRQKPWNYEFSCSNQHSVRNDRFHFIQYRSDFGVDSIRCTDPETSVELELYEIGAKRDIDPHEWNNLAYDNDYLIMRNYLKQWLPAGPNFLSKTYRAEINQISNKCVYYWGDTLAVSAIVYDTLGNPTTEYPPNTQLRWRLNNSNEYLDEVLVVDLGLVDSADFQTVSTFKLELLLMDTTNSYIHGYDLIRLNGNQSSQPEVSFDVQVDSFGQVSIVNYSSSGSIRQSIWNFGDGVVLEDEVPAPHIYDRPGHYTITNFAVYGNDPEKLCQYSQSRDVLLDSADFHDVECRPPGNLVVIDASPSKARTAWNKVYGATSYQLRSKNARGESPWVEKEVFKSNIVIPALEPEEEYEMQIKALCDTALTRSPESAWSNPLSIVTPSCRPPLAISAQNVIDTSAVIRWIRRRNSAGHLFGYSDDDGPPETSVIMDGDSILLHELTPGTEYFYALSSLCEQLTLDLYQGKESLIQSFKTLDSSSARGGGDLQLASLRVVPNPVYQRANIILETSGSGMEKVYVFNSLGKLMFAVNKKSNPGRTLELDCSSWPSGIYLVEAVADGIAVRKKFVLTHGMH